MAQTGRNLPPTIFFLGSRLVPAVCKVTSRVIPGPTTGLLNSLGTFSMDKIPVRVFRIDLLIEFLKRIFLN